MVKIPIMKILESFTFTSRIFGTVTVTKSTYAVNEALAVELFDNQGEPIAVLSVNLPEESYLLGPNEFFVKTWSENEEIARDALASGLFHATGRTSGHGLSAPIWTFA